MNETNDNSPTITSEDELYGLLIDQVVRATKTESYPAAIVEFVNVILFEMQSSRTSWTRPSAHKNQYVKLASDGPILERARKHQKQLQGVSTKALPTSAQIAESSPPSPAATAGPDPDRGG